MAPNISSIINKSYSYYASFALAALSRWPYGTNIYEREWELLIILDTCRYDALKQIAPEYDFIDTVDRYTSRGSTSPEFMAANFVPPYESEIAETAYVSANPHTMWVFEERNFPEDVHKARFKWTNWSTVDADAFGLIDNVWQYCEPLGDGRFDRDFSDPAAVTDRAIRIGRNKNFDQVIAHYLRPHSPFLYRALLEDRQMTDVEFSPYEAIRSGIAFDDVWDLYMDEHRFVLDHVETLLENFDAETAVISADHGDLFHKYFQGHASGVPHPTLRKVPWAEVPAEDSQTHHPSLEMQDEPRKETTDQLKDLGYL